MYEKYRVLFVDDEENILNSIRRSLIDESFYSHYATSGKEALEIIKDETIAVIVSDMKMPEMNGLELLNEVEKISPMTIKIALSGYTQLPQILATINQVDIFKFLTKPWEVEDLIQTITKALDYYIIKEEHEHYKNALEAKNRSYKNILKKINEVIDNANKSREMLAISGKNIIGFGRDFNSEEVSRYSSILNLKESLFELISSSVSDETKEFRPSDLIELLSAKIRHTFPQSTIETENLYSDKITAHAKMFEMAIAYILSVFYDEIDSNGLYCKIRNQKIFSVVLICPNVEGDESLLLDKKIEFTNDTINEILRMCNLNFQIIKAKGNLLVEISIENITSDMKANDQGELS